MAKRGRKKKTVSGYFRKVFAERPEWLAETSNDVILARYREDHNLAPDAKLNPKIKQNLANVKSLLRHKDRDTAGGAEKSKARIAAVAAMHSPRSAVRGANSGLETLEEMIDDCLTMAKT